MKIWTQNYTLRSSVQLRTVVVIMSDVVDKHEFLRFSIIYLLHVVCIIIQWIQGMYTVVETSWFINHSLGICLF